MSFSTIASSLKSSFSLPLNVSVFVVKSAHIQISQYEASQLQRGMERRIRQSKNRLIALDEQGKVAPSDKQKNAFAAESVRLKAREGRLKDFCRQTGRRSDAVRTRTASWNRSTSQKAVWANKKAVDNKNIFETKPGRNDSFIARFDIIKAPSYEAKFRGMGGSESVGRILTEKSRQIIKNRSGTHFEELFALDYDTGRILSYIKGKEKNSIQMTRQLKKVLTQSKEKSIIILHNHPDSSTLSTTDISTMMDYASIQSTIAIGHNGDVYFVSEIPKGEDIIREFRVSYSKHRETWSDLTAREKAWEDVSRKRGFVYERR